jgi:ferredoxin
MRVELDREKCQGHGRCYVLSSAVYGADDDGYGLVVSADVTPELRDAAMLGANNCPEDAIVVIDE